jgi:hypothetical protein
MVGGIETSTTSGWMAVAASVGGSLRDGVAARDRDGALQPAVCYSVIVVPPGVANGFPRLVAQINGMKVRTTEAGARAFYTNPAYAIADYIESSAYGMGRSVDWTTVANVAASCAATVGDGPRRVVGLIMAEPQACETWLNVLREYAGCWAIPEGSKYRLVVDGMPAEGSTKNVTGISKANPPRITTFSTHSLTSGMIVRIDGVAGDWDGQRQIFIFLPLARGVPLLDARLQQVVADTCDVIDQAVADAIVIAEARHTEGH